MSLDFAKVCGKHNAIYEAYYKQIDPKGSGAIEAMTAAKFLKKSGLSDVVLSRIWDLSDPNGKGFLDKPGFFVALKLVSLSQAGQTINMSNIYMDLANPPKVGDLPKIIPPRIQPTNQPIASGGDWSIKVIDRLKYEQLFESLKPVNGYIAGNKVKGVLMDSKLPIDTLGKIWDLADQDKDGNLDKHEFIVAMHLVYQTLDKRAVPDVLPPELQKSRSGGPPIKPQAPPAAIVPRAPSGENFGDAGFVANFPKDIAPPPVPPLPIAIPAITRVPQQPLISTQPLIPTDPLIPIGAPPTATFSDWVVTPTDLKRYEMIFRDSDRDKDGLVSGLEVKNVFLQSGVPQNCLAHIWALCDTNQSGKLTLELFALAMWMVERKQKGIEPPQVLSANMVPPSMKGIVPGVELTAQIEPKPTYSNPELEMISKEIDDLAKERRTLETEIAQKEADIRIKSGEVRSLQSELDTLTATLKQLENQRGEAQKRLDDLKAQVNKIREQCQKQEETINEQEGELNSKRSEMQKLKDEEAELEKQYDDNRKELENLTKNLQDTQLQISQVRSMVTQLLETQRQMNDALLMCRSAIESNDTEIVTEYQLKIEPDFDEARRVLERKIEEPKVSEIHSAKPTNGFAKSTESTLTSAFVSDPFTSATGRSTGFDDSFSGSLTSGFNDTFSGGFGQQQRDPFAGSGASDPFGPAKSRAVTPEPGKDDFGSDPFASLHAPTGVGQVLSPNASQRSESPSPALPPKKAKPPPRPAPPKVLQSPRPAHPTNEAFGGSSANDGGFANFADFDNKQPSIPLPQLPLPSQTKTSQPPFAASFASDSLFQSKQRYSTTTMPSLSTITANNFSSTTSLKATKLASTGSIATEQISVNKSVVNGPTDFIDDPFKDYRYEDPFSIKDPFADDFIQDDDDEESSSDGDEGKNKNETATSSSSQTFSTANSISTNVTTLSNTKFFDNFDTFNSNSSPTPSTLSAGVIVNGGKAKSLRNTPISGCLASDNSTPNTLVGSFADFDAFSTISDSASTKTNTDSKPTNSFFDAFNDNFQDFDGNFNKPPVVTPNFDAFNDNKTVDPFGGVFDSGEINESKKSSKNNKIYNDFNAFEDDFFKIQINDNSGFKVNTDATTINNGNFATFDTFSGENFGMSTMTETNNFATAFNNSINLNNATEKLSKVQNKTSLTETQRNKLNINTRSVNELKDTFTKPADKFAKDYSDADTFDADLQEALKRSMAEK